MDFSLVKNVQIQQSKKKMLMAVNASFAQVLFALPVLQTMCAVNLMPALTQIPKSQIPTDSNVCLAKFLTA
jgi:hypothetical protein